LAIDVCRIVEKEQEKDENIKTVAVLIFENNYDDYLADAIHTCIQLPTTVTDFRDDHKCKHYYGILF
jgi:hypothetical protein